MTLELENLKLENVPCPGCEAPPEEAQRFVSARDSVGHVPGVFTYLECRHCGLVFLSPRPAAEELDRIYPEDSYWDMGGESGLDLMKHAERVFIEARMDRLAGAVRRMLSPGARVLDIGSGNGDVLATFARNGFTAEGVELSPTAAKRARAVHGLTIHEGDLLGADLPADAYDCATIINVLEHCRTLAR